MSVIAKCSKSSGHRCQMRVDEYKSNLFVARHEAVEASLRPGRLKFIWSENTPNQLVLDLNDAKVTVNNPKRKMRIAVRDKIYELQLERQTWEKWIREFKENMMRSKQHRVPTTVARTADVTETDYSATIASLNKTLEALRQLSTTLKDISQAMPHAKNQRKEFPTSDRNQSEQPDKTQWRKSLPTHARAPLPNWTIGVLNEMLSKGRHFKIENTTLEYNEPMDGLQMHASQALPFTRFLDQAAKESSSPNRMALIAAFVFASQRNHQRVLKPFEPFLGETFEFDRSRDLGWRSTWEKVIAMPSTLAGHTVGRDWTWWRSSTAFLQVETSEQSAVEYDGMDGVELPKFKEQYVWSPVGFILRILKSHLSVSHRGQTSITCNNGLTCQLNFEPAEKPEEPCRVTGQVIQEQSKDQWSSVLYALSGKCSMNSKQLTRNDANGSEDLVDLDFSEARENVYSFSKFDLCLNQILPDWEKKLPPTDCRRRPDVRLLEEGKVDAALGETKRLWTLEKNRLGNSNAHQPLWFKQIQVDGKTVWRSNGKYWDKKNVDFEGVKFPVLW